MTHEREIQPESWWKERTCPVMSYGCSEGWHFHCEASRCAFWRKIRIDETGEKHGICTKA